MKWLLVLLLFIPACSPDAPPDVVQAAHILPIPHLIVTDTLDFGQIPYGAWKDSSIELYDAGPDTIRYSQAIGATTSFSLQFPAQSYIGPGSKNRIPIRYHQIDSLEHIGYDTIRSGAYITIVVLRGACKRIGSQMFSLGPVSFRFDLWGVLGVDARDARVRERYDFTYNCTSGLSAWGDTLVFHTKSYDDNTRTSTDDLIKCVLDTVAHSVKWAQLTSNVGIGTDIAHGVKGYWSRFTSITAHDIPLTRQLNGWLGILDASLILDHIDGAEYRAVPSPPSPPSGENQQLGTITGIDPSAQLTIFIE